MENLEEGGKFGGVCCAHKRYGFFHLSRNSAGYSLFFLRELRGVTVGTALQFEHVLGLVPTNGWPGVVEHTFDSVPESRERYFRVGR